MQETTIVTACDRNYVWGVYLLIASLRKNGVTYPVNVVGAGFEQDDIDLLVQFEDVSFFPAKGNLPGHILKPQAIFTATTDNIAWMDSDCIAYGNITECLYTPEEKFQIRFREEAEMGLIPQDMLEIWQTDVGERAQPRYLTQCLTNCFVLHKKHLPFIQKWEDQMLKLLQTDGVIDNSSIAYRMTDEAIFASLLCFSHQAPETTAYKGDYFTDKKVVHFGMIGKPWTFWQAKHLKWYEDVLAIVDWANQSGYRLPPVPNSLKRDHKGRVYLSAFLRSNRIISYLLR